MTATVDFVSRNPKSAKIMAKKAANVAAYEARCKRLRDNQLRLSHLRKLGYKGTDTQVLTAAERDQKHQFLAESLAGPSGGHLRRWLKDRLETRSLDILVLLIQRFFAERPNLQRIAQAA